MDNDMNIGIEISGDAASAIQATTLTNDEMTRLESAIAELTGAFDTFATSSAKAESGVASVGKSAAGADTAVQTLTDHSYLLARGLDAAGVAGGAAALRIGAMGDMLEQLADAQPLILGIAAAFAAVVGAFDFFKDGVSEAEKFQQSMEQVRLAVQGAGGDWGASEQQIEKWSSAMAIAAGITGDQAVSALNRLVEAGATTSDAIAELSVGAQMVTAGMGDWDRVVSALTQAQSGNLMLLGRLDPAVRSLIAAHADLSTILEKVEEDTKNQITQNDSAAQAAIRLHGAYANLSDELGKEFLPALGEIYTGLAVVVDAMGHLESASEEAARGSIAALIGFGKAALDVGHAASDALHGNLPAAATDLKSALGDLSTVGHGVGTVFQGIGKAFDDAFHPVQNWAHDTIDAMKTVSDAAKGVSNLTNDPHAGKIGAGSSGSKTPFDFQDVALPDPTQQVDGYKTLIAALDDLPKSIQGYQDAVTSLDLALQQAHSQQDAAASALQTAGENADVAGQQYNSFGDAMKSGVIPATQQNNEILKQLKDAWTQAKTSLDAAQASYTKITDGVNALTAAQVKEQSQLQSAQNDLPNFLAKTTAAMQEQLDTFKMTNAEKVDYYAAALANLNTLDANYDDEYKQILGKEVQAYEAAKQDEYKAEEEFTQKAGQGISTFLDDIIVEHKSLAASLKDIYDSILQSFVNMVSQMAAKWLASGLMQMMMGGAPSYGGLNLSSIGGFGGLPSAWNPFGSANAATASSAATSGGGFSSFTGGASSPSASMASRFSPAAALGIAASPLAAAAASGTSIGLNSGALAINGGVFPGVFNPATPGAATSGSTGGILQSILGGGGIPWGTLIQNPFGALGTGGASASASLGSVGAAGIGGALLSQLLYSGRGYSDLGGALGGVAGMFAGLHFGAALGPWGALGGALLGGLIGSLFGDHFNPADEPDIYQQDAWGQSNADMQGMVSPPMVANGKNYTMDSWTSQATGGKGWNILFENFVQQFRNNQNGLPSDLQSVFPQIMSLWGGATNHQYFNPDGKDGNLDIGSGQRAQWTTFWGLVQQYGPEISQLMALYTPMDAYNASTSGTITSLGSFTPYGSPYIQHDFPDGGGGTNQPKTYTQPVGGSGGGGYPPGAGGGPGPKGGGTGPVTNITINTSFSGTLASQTNIERAIQEAVAKAQYNGFDMIGL